MTADGTRWLSSRFTDVGEASIAGIRNFSSCSVNQGLRGFGASAAKKKGISSLSVQSSNDLNRADKRQAQRRFDTASLIVSREQRFKME